MLPQGVLRKPLPANISSQIACGASPWGLRAGFTFWVGVMAIGASALAETSLEVSGSAGAFASRSNFQATLLVPEPEAGGYANKEFGNDLRLNLDWAAGALSSHAQFRISSTSAEDAEGEPLHIDEFYLQLAPADTLFFYLGRKRFAFGQAYGLNPVDLLHDPLQENPIYPNDTSRSFVEGTDIFSMELLLDGGSALKMLYAPKNKSFNTEREKDFAYLSYAVFHEPSTIDLTISLFSGVRQGVGFSASSGIGDAQVVYVDTTLRQGRDRSTITGLAPDNTLQIAAEDDNRFHVFHTIGWGVTFENAVSLNLEYSRNGNGYTDAEWEDIHNTITEIANAGLPQAPALLGQINSLLRHYTLRQEYGFLRIARSNLFGSEIEVEFAGLHNLDDDSGASTLRFERSASQTTTLGLYFSQSYGASGSEFRLRPQLSSVSFYGWVDF